MKALIIGGTGLISGAVRAELQLRGAVVSIVTRGRSAAAPAGVEWIRQDRREEGPLAEALAGTAENLRRAAREIVATRP